MTAPSPFRKELEAAVNARHSRLNPFTEKWVTGELSRAQLGAWAAQHYQYVSQFPRWCATVACGVSRAEVETARQLPTTRGLTAWCYEMSHRSFHIAAAGLLVGLESQLPGIYRRNLPPLKTHYGFTDHEVEFFAIHIEADEVHGERGYAIVERHATTAEKKAEAIEAVRQATLMRWQYMTGLHRAFILKEEP